jgi:hypothetical protein
LGSFVVSRTLAGGAAGLLERVVYRQRLGIAVLVVLAGSLLCDLLFYLFVPRESVGPWAIRTASTALYNAAFAMPLFLAAKLAAGRASPPNIA